MNIFYRLSVILSIFFWGLPCYSQSVSGKMRGHDYVDLGLPSGIKWATCNVGATKISDSGDYFAWGENETKEKYGWSTYQFSSGELDSLKKYCCTNEFGIVDNKKNLDSNDDVCTATWGKKWRMPSIKELQELISNCHWEWSNDFEGSGKAGQVGTSQRNGNRIFFPASGQRYEAKYAWAQFPKDFSIPIVNAPNAVEFEGEFGGYWSSSLCVEKSKGAFLMNVSKYDVECDVAQRCIGHSVRGVCE